MPRATIICVEVKPKMLRWARDRAGVAPEELAHRFPKLADWEREEARPTLKQLENFARTTHTPIGYLFLPDPPVERVPIPDFRTVENRRLDRPSPDLLETIYLYQQRQEWYLDFARSMREERLPFIGSATLESNVETVAAEILRMLGFDIEERRQCPTWTEALCRFIDLADNLGVLVMVNGVVGSNNTRKLDPDEFRGFAITDELAPLVFINGADTKSAQMFTFHELAHSAAVARHLLGIDLLQAEHIGLEPFELQAQQIDPRRERRIGLGALIAVFQIEARHSHGRDPPLFTKDYSNATRHHRD